MATGIIDFSGEAATLRGLPRCSRCHAQSSGESESAIPIYRTKAASADTPDFLRAPLSYDPRISVLSTDELEPFIQPDWKSWAGIKGTHKWRGEETVSPLALGTAIDVPEFALRSGSILAAGTNSSVEESVRFRIARVRPLRTWTVEKDGVSSFPLVDESRPFVEIMPL